MSEADMLEHPVPSRPVTNYLDIPIPTSGSPDDNEFGLRQPSDTQIDQAVYTMLQGADLNTVTKKNVRQRLEGMFGVDLSGRKAVINSAIDRVILAQS